ncbi:hypothetical protein BGZ94_006324 [Podila epigama]|nr:hypothetical protein BGZ94_006324 [Podila epigama]
MADKQDPGANRSSSPKLYYIKEGRGTTNSVPQELSASQDLMATYNLLPLYNQYVKQRLENNEPAPPIEPTIFPYISDLPGKNVIRPGNYIRTLLETPEKSYGPIHNFSSSTLRDGFNLRPGPVPGFDPSVLGTEEDGIRSSRQEQAGAGATGAAPRATPTIKQETGHIVPSGAGKKKRKYEHEHEHSHHDGEGDSEHRKKKKRKREREEQNVDVVD